MNRTITIRPVTRIEGHAHITIQLDDRDQVVDTQFHLTQFRGFEKICEGRPFREMPALMARTCGICPVSHLVASSKAGDELLSVTISRTASMLRQVMNLAQITQSHALSFFHLSSPDLLLGMDSDPGQRHILGVYAAEPQLARDGIRLRQIGQQIIELLGGKRIHPGWMIPGGVSEPLSREKRDTILAMLPEGLDIAKRTFDRFHKQIGQFSEEIACFGNFPTLFLSIVSPTGHLEHYDGTFRIKDHRGRMIEEQVPTNAYARLIGEAVEPFSYMKSPYYLPLGYPSGIYRVGPLARLNNCDVCGTPAADAALEVFRELQPAGPVQSSFHYHFARLVEIVFAMERSQELLEDPEILGDRVRARARGNRLEGVGVAEAPRGTLIHHYRTDDDGLMTWANLIIATGHNNLAMNESIRQVAERFVSGKEIPEGMLNRVEAVVRCYDPCLSCASHAFGQMPLAITLLDPRGQVIARRTRS